MSKDTKMTMEELLAEHEDAFKTLEKNDTVEGTVVSANRNGVWVDLGQYGSGLIVGPELADRSLITGDLKPGSLVSASVVDPEFEGGYAILSMKRASKEKAWSTLARMAKDREMVEVSPTDANKGGLLVELEGVRGFLPVSQLSTEKYPRVADKDEIQARLSELIGKPMNVIVLDADEGENKLIFSEKAANRGEVTKVLDKFKVGDKVSGRVTGVVDFGVFVNVDGVEGLVHISEISWERISDPGKIYKVGDKVDAEIIGIENDRFSLSIKRLTDDPWAEAAKTFSVHDKVEGEVTRITPFGAFVRIHDNIEALVHISELGDGHVAAPGDVVVTAMKYQFTILNIDKATHKIALSLKAARQKTTASEAKTVVEKAEKVEDVEIVENIVEKPVKKAPIVAKAKMDKKPSDVAEAMPDKAAEEAAEAETTEA